VFVYHTGDEKSVVGEARVTREAEPDREDAAGRLVVIGIRAGARLKSPVSLATLKGDKRFADSPLVRQGRLSVVPITDEQARAIVEHSGS
jgi:predicted RNA-binding protein with PUA-like domain